MSQVPIPGQNRDQGKGTTPPAAQPAPAAPPIITVPAPPVDQGFSAPPPGLKAVKTLPAQRRTHEE